MAHRHVASGQPADRRSWDAIVRHYEDCLRKHGTTPQGVDWPNGAGLATRFGIMLELLAGAGERPSLLDLGCGPGLLLDYMSTCGMADRVIYRGIDLSQPMIDAARSRWPASDFACRDVLADPLPDQSVDVIIMNGVLTERVSLTVEAMTSLAQSLVVATFRAARVGIAFNVMNVHVDWQREDLFHWPFDSLAAFLKREVSSNFAFRADYGLYEYTCFVRRQPCHPAGPDQEAWWER